MRRVKSSMELRKLKPLLKGAQKIRERKAEESRALIAEMLQKQYLTKNMNGEYSPVDKDDTLLLKWCNKQNSELRKAKAIVENATNPNALSPIQVNLVGFSPLNKRDKLLLQWCNEKNEIIRQERAKGGR